MRRTDASLLLVLTMVLVVGATVLAYGGARSDEARLEWFSKNRMGHESFEYRIRRLEIFDNGTAMVAGTRTFTDRDEDGPHTVVHRSSNEPIKSDSSRRAVASRMSGVERTDG
jgi:hypothetical protein